MIFAENAPQYWAAGIPVIPLKRWNSPSKGAGKAPILNEWQQYGEVMPSESVRGLWLNTYPDSNIGLPFGPASGLCAIDIDTEDETLIKAIRDALPPSPWVRIGKKGMGLIFKWQGQRNFKLRDSQNKSLVEFLGKGNQMVLPPSIHPDTGNPYVSDTNLWEVLDLIEVIPLDLENVLRKALEGQVGVVLASSNRVGPVDVVPQGERDIQMVKMAGYLANVVEGIDKKDQFPLGKAMDHMRTWVENFTASSSGDDMDPDKGVSKLIEFLLKDVEAGKTLPKGWDSDLTEPQREHPSIKQLAEKNQTQRWTVAKAKDWMDATFFEDSEMDFVIDKIDELIRGLAKDEQFSESEFNLLVGNFQRYYASVGLKASKPDLRAAFRDARRGDSEMAEDHEAIARQVIEKMSRTGEVRYAQGAFWQWGGSCFDNIDRDDVYMQVAEGVKGNVLARRHNDYEAITKTIQKLVRGELAEEMEDGVNFANGFLDINLNLHDHSPKYGKTFTMPFNYIPERAGEAHKWLEYLEKTWGDDEDYFDKVNALQEAFAATMFGIATQLQRAILLHGKARSGKSQILNVLSALMPPSSQCSVPPTLWRERFQQAPLVGKALNVCGELPEESVIDGRAFKEVIEGTAQNTELKGQSIFQYRPIAAHWFASNFLPRSRDTSAGFARRWLILDFNRPVPASERILNYHEVLISEEREAIAAWAVQGLPRVISQRDYTQPESHILRLNQIVRGNNSVAAFLQSSDRVRKSEVDSWVDTRVLFDQYVIYMKDVSKGWSVTYERYLQMLDELGHDVRQYMDKSSGSIRFEARGLEIVGPVLPSKPI